MLLERWEQDGQQRLQALAADSIGSLPQNHQRLTNRLVVDASSNKPYGLAGRLVAVQDANRVLSMVPGQRDEFVKDAEFLRSTAFPIPTGHRSDQLVPGLHADFVLLRHSSLPIISAAAGSRFGEATTLARSQFERGNALGR
jgi:hypothetical protein